MSKSLFKTKSAQKPAASTSQTEIPSGTLDAGVDKVLDAEWAPSTHDISVELTTPLVVGDLTEQEKAKSGADAPAWKNVETTAPESPKKEKKGTYVPPSQRTASSSGGDGGMKSVKPIVSDQKTLTSETSSSTKAYKPPSRKSPEELESEKSVADKAAKEAERVRKDAEKKERREQLQKQLDSMAQSASSDAADLSSGKAEASVASSTFNSGQAAKYVGRPHVGRHLDLSAIKGLPNKY